MKQLPKWWYIKNGHQEIRDWFAEKYKEQGIKNWHYSYIGYLEAMANNGVLGGSKDCMGRYKSNAQEISFEDFQRLVLNKTPIYEIY